MFANKFQRRVREWADLCFGTKIVLDPQERNHRFLEEALEMVQACGCTKSEAIQLVNYVYGRPVGAQVQEAGGVAVTFSLLCDTLGLDAESCGWTELARIHDNIAAIRAKNAAKPKHSPLPGAV